jgi:hypothetical protein
MCLWQLAVDFSLRAYAGHVFASPPVESEAQMAKKVGRQGQGSGVVPWKEIVPLFLSWPHVQGAQQTRHVFLIILTTERKKCLDNLHKKNLTSYGRLPKTRYITQTTLPYIQVAHQWTLDHIVLTDIAWHHEH